jgi:hypothetical protein
MYDKYFQITGITANPGVKLPKHKGIMIGNTGATGHFHTKCVTNTGSLTGITFYTVNHNVEGYSILPLQIFSLETISASAPSISYLN